MEKNLKLNIFGIEECFISGILPETLSTSMFVTETSNAVVVVNNCNSTDNNVRVIRDVLPRGNYHVEPFKKNGILYFKVPYFAKSTTMTILTEKKVFDETKSILPLHHVRMDFGSFDKTFMEQYNEMWELNTHIPDTDLKLNDSKERVAVLRPSNFTLGLFAFAVEHPSYFRRHEFQIIVYEFRKLWMNAREGKECPKAAESLKLRVAGCGLRALNPAVYNLSLSELLKSEDEPAEFILTPYIDGTDMRILRAGNTVHTHTGTLSIDDLRDGTAYKIMPIDLLKREDYELASDVMNIFKTLGIMLSGSIDLRESDTSDNLYFLEASPSFNVSHYDEEFIRNSTKEVLEVIDQAWLNTNETPPDAEVTK